MKQLDRRWQVLLVTGVAVFMASEEASFITGADYLVDGGLTNH